MPAFKTGPGGRERRGDMGAAFFKLTRGFTGGCLIWRGPRDSHGYGQFRWNRRRVMAHRLAWELANGPIPDGAVVCHRCDRPGCVRVEHLFLGTQADNVADALSKGRHSSQHQAGKRRGAYHQAEPAQGPV